MQTIHLTLIKLEAVDYSTGTARVLKQPKINALIALANEAIFPLLSLSSVLFSFCLFLKATASEGADPERMYKLVLAGDAAVGKSSFILRLCKNKFHTALNSTLGM